MKMNDKGEIFYNGIWNNYVPYARHKISKLQIVDKVPHFGIVFKNNETIAIVFDYEQAEYIFNNYSIMVLCIDSPRCSYVTTLIDAKLFFEIEM